MAGWPRQPAAKPFPPQKLSQNGYKGHSDFQDWHCKLTNVTRILRIGFVSLQTSFGFSGLAL
jgi:hypothetical protein